MPLSPRATRGFRNGLVLTGAALGVLGLAACTPPSFVGSGSTPGTQVLGSGSSATDRPAPSEADRGQRPAPAPTTQPVGTSPSNGDGTAASGNGGTPPVHLPSAPLPGTGGGSRGSSLDGRVLIGTTDGGYHEAVAATGVQLADHMYSHFSSKVPQAAMITVAAGSETWPQVAAAGPGSALYSQIVTWAQTIKARGASVMVAYSHEPEAGDKSRFGTPADFIAAFRHVEDIFNQQGATNVLWTWQMTAWSFTSKPTSPQYAAKWYPGDDWVDIVGADGYNWLSCSPGASSQYTEVQKFADPVLAFARAHGKKASFPEYASAASPTRTQWLANAQAYFAQNKDVVAAAFYFNRFPPEAEHHSCQFGLTSASEYSALRQMAQSSAQFRIS